MECLQTDNTPGAMSRLMYSKWSFYRPIYFTAQFFFRVYIQTRVAHDLHVKCVTSDNSRGPQLKHTIPSHSLSPTNAVLVCGLALIRAVETPSLALALAIQVPSLVPSPRLTVRLTVSLPVQDPIHDRIF